MITPTPVTLQGFQLRLEPLAHEHAAGLAAAVSDGELWKLWFTTVPSPTEVAEYIEKALDGQRAGTMLPWVVRELSLNEIIGSTRFHDIMPETSRVEIGYTFYAKRWQRTRVNGACKRLLLAHAFENLGCEVVGLRTDHFNLRSQHAIESLGAKKDGVVRGFQTRRDGSPRDTVFYSVLRAEWPAVRAGLDARIARE
jgi:RimJ/RimL family protein N-acetyltransferase